MTPDDRIRSSVETALGELATRVNQDVRAVVEQLITVALEDRDQALAAARRDAREEAATDIQRQLEEAQARAFATIDEAVSDARTDERTKAAMERRQLIEVEMAALARLLDGVRGLDGATTLTEVLDALGQSAGREASRAAVLVLRDQRLLGWKLTGFGAMDAQPKAIDLGLDDSGVIGLAASSGRPVTTRDGQDGGDGPGFVPLPTDRMGFAVPVIVGGRVVAVVYTDRLRADGEPAVPSVWPDVIEVLARHAARCLEALTVQKTANPQSPRFWVSGAVRSNPASGGSAVKSGAETQSPTRAAPPGVMT